MSKGYIIAGLMVIFMTVLCEDTFCLAAEKRSNTVLENWEENIALDEVEDVFYELQGNKEFQLGEYVRSIVSGEVEFSFSSLWKSGIEQLEIQLQSEKNAFVRILALGIVSGIIMNFSGTIGDKNLGETGFYIIFTILFTTVSMGFYVAYEVAEEAVLNLIVFMKALVPSFSLSLCFGGGVGTSLVFYETMLIALSIIETIMANVLLPGVQIYFLLGMINQLSDNHFSKMVELVRSFLKGSIKVLYGILLGYQGIQGILLPVMDKVKSNTVLQTAKGLPGVGNTLGSAADTIIGSGMLIKSAVGVGGIICILCLCLYPLIKLMVFTLLYRVSSALVQPVSDKRVVAVIHIAAESGKLLLWYLLAGTIMFLLSITIVLAATNMI